MPQAAPLRSERLDWKFSGWEIPQGLGQGQKCNVCPALLYNLLLNNHSGSLRLSGGCSWQWGLANRLWFAGLLSL